MKHSIRHRHIHRTRGFTLMEALIVVAIISILLGLAVPNVISYSRSLKLTSLDDSAHSIFMAAQNNLMAMKNAGEDLMDVFGLDEETDKVPLAKTKTAAIGEYYAIDKSNGLEKLLPNLSIDAELKAQNCVVEIDPHTGAVYAVWFWESHPFLYRTQAYNTARPERSDRLRNHVMVGYYGGTQIFRPEIRQTPLPTVEIVNAEELLVNVTVSVEEDTEILLTTPILLTVTLTSEGKDHEIVADAPLNYRNEGGKGKYCATLVLDTLKEGAYPTFFNTFMGKDYEKQGMRLRDWKDTFGEPIVTPGKDFDLTVKVCVEEDGYLPQYVYHYGENSLFASVEKSTARIAYGRHLQNLDPAVSGVSFITAAEQIASVDFDAPSNDTNPVRSWKDTYGVRKFLPIVNSSLTHYDGKKHEIVHLSIQKEEGAAGLFKTVQSGTRLENIYLKDAEIHAPIVGGLVGKADDLSIAGCRVYLTEESSKAEGAAARLFVGETVGGLIGTSGEGGRGELKIHGSLASTNEFGDTVGGLIGMCENPVEIENSYAAGYLTGAKAGGLIGIANETTSHVTLKTSYAAGVIAKGEKTALAGGLIAQGKPHSAEDCYAAVRYDRAIIEAVKNGNKIEVYGTFRGDTEHTAEYVSQMGLEYRDGGTPITSFELYVWGGYQHFDDLREANPYKLLPETEHRYGLSEKYPYRMIREDGKDVPHYGDWLEETEAYLVYYEQYDDKTYGIYADYERFKTNTLRASAFEDELDDRSYVIDDGYSLFVLSTPDNDDALSLDVSIGDKPYKFELETFQDVDFRGTKVNCSMLVIKEPDISIKSSWTEYDSKIDPLNQPIRTYYTTLVYKIVYTDIFGTTYVNPYTTKTYYFNPHFACDVFEDTPTLRSDASGVYIPKAKTGAEGTLSESAELPDTAHYTAAEGDVVIRSARHLSNLHCYTNTESGISGVHGIAGVKSANFHQLFDIDFLLYVQTRLAGGGNYNDRIYPAITYNGLYDGHEHVIRNIFLSRQAIKDGVGLFAKSVGTDLKNIFIVNPVGFVSENDFGNYMGGLVGHITGGSVENCGIYTEAKEEENAFVTYKPYYRHKAVNSNDHTVVLGGLIGYAQNCKITGSFAAVKIFGHTAGGFIGEMASGTVVKDCYAGGYTKYNSYYSEKWPQVKGLDNVGGYPSYSEQSGTDSINVGGGGTSIIDGKQYEGYIGGFVGIVDEGASFEGICYSTCSVRGSFTERIGLFAGKTPSGYTTRATLYSVGVIITEGATPQTLTLNGNKYSFYQKGKARNESYLKAKANVKATAPTAKAYPYNDALNGTPYPYLTNLQKHYGDWV